jgi:hypothetical protein
VLLKQNDYQTVCALTNANELHMVHRMLHVMPGTAAAGLQHCDEAALVRV